VTQDLVRVLPAAGTDGEPPGRGLRDPNAPVWSRSAPSPCILTSAAWSAGRRVCRLGPPTSVPGAAVACGRRSGVPPPLGGFASQVGPGGHLRIQRGQPMRVADRFDERCPTGGAAGRGGRNRQGRLRLSRCLVHGQMAKGSAQSRQSQASRVRHQDVLSGEEPVWSCPDKCWHRLAIAQHAYLVRHWRAAARHVARPIPIQPGVARATCREQCQQLVRRQWSRQSF
jgi:hypothetical protein